MFCAALTCTYIFCEMSRLNRSGTANAFADDSHDNTSFTKRKREATVYDAVAGELEDSQLSARQCT